MADFAVATPQFTGPLDLLLTLVEDNKLSLNDVDLAQVADQFVVHVKETPDLPSEHIAQFIVIASRLLLLKSRLFVPDRDDGAADDASHQRTDLVASLAVYRQYRDIARRLEALLAAHQRLVGRQVEMPRTFSPSADVSLIALRDAYALCIAAQPQTLPPQTDFSPAERISLDEMITQITTALADLKSVAFSDLTSQHNVQEVILAFLAVLELHKKGSLVADQTSGSLILSFGDEPKSG